MRNIEVSCNQELKFSQKPSHNEAAMLNYEVPGSVMSISPDRMEDFARLVGEEGVPFCPATFHDGVRKGNNFSQTQLIALDFDNSDAGKSISFEEFQKRMSKYHIPCQFAYSTMSSSDSINKFRAVFKVDTPITSKRCAEVMINALHTMFPEADSSCRDVSRLFYGGKELLLFDKTLPEVTAQSVVSAMTSYLEDTYGQTNYKRAVAKFNKQNHLVANAKGMPKVIVTDAIPLTQNGAEGSGVSGCDKNSPNPSVFREGFGDNLSKKYYAFEFTENTTHSAPRSGSTVKNHLDYRAADLIKLREKCELFREFETKSRRLHHQELFGLATCLTEVETGSRLFLDIVSDPLYSLETDKNDIYWNHNLKNYISEYKPSTCENFCPYCDTCCHGKNMLSTLKLRQGELVRINNFVEKVYSLDEAVADFEKALMRAINKTLAKWFVIKAQTSLGKTETYIVLLGNPKYRILVAVPTNKLKREVVARAAKKGIKLVASPSLHELELEMRPESWREIQRRYEAGISVQSYVKERAEKNHPEYEPIFVKYLEELERFNTCSGNAITTHRKLLTLDVSDYDFVIVDEDIIFSSIISNRSEMPQHKLRKIVKSFPKNSPIVKKARRALRYFEENNQENQYFQLPAVPYDPEEYDEIASKIKTNVSAFAQATHFCFHAKSTKKASTAPTDCISFMNPTNFDKTSKYIMVSATADKRICEAYFGADQVDFYDCKKAPYLGELRQYCSCSMSRAFIGERPNLFDRISEFTGNSITITFKKFEVGDLYFGNTAGYDDAKGKDIDVIGTPHQPEFIYKLFASAIDDGCDVDAKMRPGIEIQRNGYSFRFMSYEEELLQAIQLYMIESELEQAVGRARLLRYACTVNLFSNYPLMQAKLTPFDLDALKNTTQK